MSEFKPDAELTMTIDETATGTVVNNLATTIPGFALDARQGKVLDDKKLDKAHVANNLTVIEEGWALDARQGKWLNENKLGFSDIANDLETDDVNKVLSAAQGKAIVGRTAPNAEKLGGKAPEYYLQPPNLLDNGELLIAQAGFMGMHGSKAYLADRWVAEKPSYTSYDENTKTVTFAAESSPIVVSQKVSHNVAGKTLTLAIKASNVTGNVHLSERYVQDGHKDFRIFEGINCYSVTGGEGMQVLFWSQGGGSMRIEWIALYEGAYTADTLPPFVGFHPRVESLRLGYAVQPRNLLDNSDFTNPVNQRGAKSYNGVNKYTIDRWYVTGNASSTTEIADGTGVILKASAGEMYFAQRFNSCNELAGKYVTLAFNTSEGLLIKTGKFPESAGNYSRTDLISNVALGTIGWSANGFGWIDIVALKNTEITLYSASLFLGEYTAETLPPYVPNGYTAELAECQRYYLPLTNDPAGYGYIGDGGANAYIGIAVPVKMRITPSLGHNGSGNFCVRAGGSTLEKSVSGFDFTVIGHKANSVALKIGLNDTLPNVHAASGFWADTVKPYLSADL